MKTWLLIIWIATGSISCIAQQDTVINTTQQLPQKAGESFALNEQIVTYQRDTLVFGRPNLLHNMGNVPSDMWQIAKSPFHRNSIIPLSAVVVSTGLLLWQDQSLLNGIQKLSADIGLSSKGSYKPIISIGGSALVKAPRNLNTALYELGLGGTSMLLAGGLWIYGKRAHSFRETNAACDLAETFVTMGLTTQIMKRISGRQSPFESTAKGGRWRPFPSFSAFQKNTPAYDAFPSGHLATLVSTITVLATDYPEKKWIVPVGCVVAASCAYAMVNTEVHWVSDYPLAIAIGYLSGKIVTWRHKKNKSCAHFIP